MQKILAFTAACMFAVLPFASALPALAATPWNTTGSYVVNMEYSSVQYPHDMVLVQDGSGNLTGHGGSPAGANVYTWVINSGTVVGNVIDFTANYTATPDAVTPQTVIHIVGAIALDGTISGTWSDNYQGGARSGALTTVSGAAVPAGFDITVTAENFNTNKGLDYWGATTGYALSGADAGKVASVSVALYDASNNLLVTNTSKSAAKVNNTLQGPHYSSAFIVSSGTYTTSSTWNFGVWTPKINVMPAKMVVTVTDINGGTYTAQNTSFQASLPSEPTWESLFTGSFAAQDFGVVNYDVGGGLGSIKGYTAGFGLTDATLAGATSVVVKLYSAGNVLLQTDTAILPKFNADITGTQFSSPFDVSGTFAYATDGYWTNAREAQYGQSVPATKVVATVTLLNGMVLTAENTVLTGDAPSTIYPVDIIAPAVPVLLTPANNGVVTTAGLTAFDWTDVTDPSSPVVYYFQASNSSAVNPDGSFVSPVSSQGPLAVSTIPSPGTPAGVYYWHVRAVDNASNSSAWTSAWKVTVDNTVPPVVTIPTDKNQCKNNGWKSFTNPTFKNQGQCVSYVETHNTHHEEEKDSHDNKNEKNENKGNGASRGNENHND